MPSPVCCTGASRGQGADAVKVGTCHIRPMGDADASRRKRTFPTAALSQFRS